MNPSEKKPKSRILIDGIEYEVIATRVVMKGGKPVHRTWFTTKGEVICINGTEYHHPKP